MKNLKLTLALACSLLVSSAAVAQTGTSSAPASSAASGGMGQQGIRDYLLGPGDILELRVFNETQFDGTFEITNDGNIVVPFVETPIEARCRRVEDVRKDVIAALSKMLKRPQINLNVKERRSRVPAVVFGAVLSPQRYEMNRRATLIELISMSGGFTEKAAGTIQIIHTQQAVCEQDGLNNNNSLASVPLSTLATNASPSTPEVAPEAASSSAITDVKKSDDGATAEGGASSEKQESVLATETDYLKLPMDIFNIEDVRLGKQSANPVIRPGDVIKVDEAQPIYVTGAVIAPQNIYLRPNMTLTRALAMVGGTTKIAKKDKIRIRRQQPGAQQVEVLTVNYDAIRKQKANDIYLQPYDIIEVGEAGVFSKQRIPELITGLGSQSISGLVGNLPLRVLY